MAALIAVAGLAGCGTPARVPESPSGVTESTAPTPTSPPLVAPQGSRIAKWIDLAAGDSPYAVVSYLIDSDQDRTSNNPYPSTIICLLQDSTGRSLAGSAKY